MKRAGPKIKLAAWPFLKWAWARFGSLGLGPGFSLSGRVCDPSPTRLVGPNRIRDALFTITYKL